MLTLSPSSRIVKTGSLGKEPRSSASTSEDTLESRGGRRRLTPKSSPLLPPQELKGIVMAQPILGGVELSKAL